ncbi:MAG TPA: BrnT family toxin [Bryobacteraceae bacterium]|nr:BrnT family toxin [Bryobacteraceae bacterium]
MYNCAYVLIEWDPGKARLNLNKHGVSFADAVIALEDDGALTVRDPFSAEERWLTMGLDGLGRVLVVVYTWRGETLRLISARKSTPRERRCYEDANETGI